ncbi:hypothetical protein DDE82_003931 [Stemphylium lycopersici]|uniref:Uncharacterized protein n=1 Tax=Stemphylium lycopersici TaxID=183478 RepID=A0A364MS51_STELY|nr:hypothetical protein TW65_71791 [Stemphylium lycopersici]RAR01743.1 hypothetical protein DDE83_008812 [Stemphylium lycopersici]RAR05464.1 hypothetical protein DDE82_003931 [Stemphylium lycopersici]
MSGFFPWLALISVASAALLPPPVPAPTAPAVLPRQDASDANTTVGFYVIGTLDDTTAWATSVFPETESYLFTREQYWQKCPSSSVFEVDGITTTSVLLATGCSAWTSCSGTTLYNGDSSSTCGGDFGLCYTDLKFSSSGAPSAYTRIYCDWTGRHGDFTTSLYEVLPADATPTPTTSFDSSSSAERTSARVPSSTSSPSSANQNDSDSDGSKDNTGVIAGSVVGGLAVIAFAGVAVLYILKRAKRHEKPTPRSSCDSETPEPQAHGRAEMTGVGYHEAPSYSPMASKYGHTINGGELDAQHTTAELGAMPEREPERRF